MTTSNDVPPTMDIQAALLATGRVCSDLANRANALQNAIRVGDFLETADASTFRLVQDLDYIAQALQSVDQITRILSQSSQTGEIPVQKLDAATHLANIRKEFSPEEEKVSDQSGEVDLF